MRLADLPTLPPGGIIRGAVLHWSAGRYRTIFPEHYHFCVLGPRPDGTGDGEIVAGHPVLNNLRLIRPGMEYAAHTRGRNSGRLGVAVMAMYGATMADWGAFPPTARQVEAMCSVAGLIVAKYGLQVAWVRTHGEWAKADGYYPDRWEWHEQAVADRLRRKVAWYAERAL